MQLTHVCPNDSQTWYWSRHPLTCWNDLKLLTQHYPSCRLLWAKAKEEDTAAWRDPVRGHHLERISSSIQRFISYTPIISATTKEDEALNEALMKAGHRSDLSWSTWCVVLFHDSCFFYDHTCSDQSHFSSIFASHLLWFTFLVRMISSWGDREIRE